MKIPPEQLAYWFLRLNGFLTIPNLIVHAEEPQPGGGFGQRTDIDVLGVRFPARLENSNRPMQDFPAFTADTERIQVVLCEVAKAGAGVNTAWKTSSRQNMEKVLRTGGFQPLTEVDTIAAALYATGGWSNASMSIKILCLGKYPNKTTRRTLTDVEQLLWDEHVLPFIYYRFRAYANEKRLHVQWDDIGHQLYDMAQNIQDPAQFAAYVQADWQ